MRKAWLVLLLVLAAGFSAGAEESQISVDLQRECYVASTPFEFHGATYNDILNTSIAGINQTVFFEYLPRNYGEMSHSRFNISIYNETGHHVNMTDRGAPYNESEKYLLNSTSYNTGAEASRLFDNETLHFLEPFRHNTSAIENHSEGEMLEYNSSYEPMVGVPKMQQFTTDIPTGDYTAEMRMKYRCEFNASDFDDVTAAGKTMKFSELNPSEYNVTEEITVEGLNASRIDGNYVQTVEKLNVQKEEFTVISVEGEGLIPDSAGENDKVDQQIDVNTVVKALENVSNVDIDVERTENASLNLNKVLQQFAEQTNFDRSIQQELERELAEGNANLPGVTPQPEPEPEPEPTPLLSLDVKPIKATYTAPRNRYTEIKFNITNIGEEAVGNLSLAPRFNDRLDWERREASIGGLEPGESTNATAYVQPSRDARPGIYQVPFYASNAEEDLEMEYADIRVLEQVFEGKLTIQEAPRELDVVKNSSNPVPILLKNNGQEDLENLEVEVSPGSCGSINTVERDSLAPGETLAVSPVLNASNEIQECEARVLASSDTGLAFADFTIDVNEGETVVPEQFRVPLVATLWTLVLLLYAVVSKLRDLHNLMVRLPLVMLVVGETFIVVYLASTYYGLIPPEILPFSPVS